MTGQAELCFRQFKGSVDLAIQTPDELCRLERRDHFVGLVAQRFRNI